MVSSRPLHGEGGVGAILAMRDDVDVIAHVGSTATGRSIAASAAATGAKTLLENGGNDPLVIDEDVDPEWAAGQAALGAFANSGQICVAVERIYVHEAIAEPFLAALVKEAEVADPGAAGGPSATATTCTPTSKTRLGRGARLLTGGVLPDGPGAHYPATVLTGWRQSCA